MASVGRPDDGSLRKVNVYAGFGGAVCTLCAIKMITPEYCFLWIPHWSTCMTKIEWATWMQVGVGVLAVYAAVRAVRAAHELATSARDQEKTKELMADVEKEYRRFRTLHERFEQASKDLAEKQSINAVPVDRLKELARPVLATDYAVFKVDRLIDPLIDFQEALRAAVGALERMESFRRKGVQSELPIDGYVSAVKKMEALLPVFDGWLARRVARP